MKNKIAIIVSTAALLALCSGCSMFQPAVPTTVIAGNIGNQAFSLKNPKNTEITKLSFKVETNGTAELSFDSLKSVNDSNIISAGYAGQASVVTTTGDAVLKAVQAGASMAAQAAK